MPPKQRISKEMILEQAFMIADKQGISAVTSRSIAKLLDCSIQPIFSHFPTMEELRKATFDYACKKFEEEVLSNEDNSDFLSLTTKWTVNLARRRPNLYRLLYLSGGLYGSSMTETMMNYESNKRLINKMTEQYGLVVSQCQDILTRCCLLLVGVCTMICENSVTFTDEQISMMTKQTVQDMIQGARKETK